MKPMEERCGVQSSMENVGKGTEGDGNKSEWEVDVQALMVALASAGQELEEV